MIHKFNQKHIHAIRNMDDSLTELQAIEKALEFTAAMCDPKLRDRGTLFYIDNDDEGAISLEVAL